MRKPGEKHRPSSVIIKAYRGRKRMAVMKYLLRRSSNDANMKRNDAREAQPHGEES
jgi:hypothetical protein